MRGAKDGSDIAYLPLFSEVSQSDHSIVCYSKRHDVFLNLLVTGGTSSRSDDRVGPDMGATALCHQVWMEARRCAPLCDVVRILKAKVAMTIKKARIKRSSSVEKAHARALQSAGQWLWVILAYNALQNASQPYKYHKVIQKVCGLK
ncbi:hypothetical protein SARC_01376 [Sphaeroforma arctica JP610]|uniref:Uncharacterized protein n=1 Tax=Sphaeroforma arctica JP610 TaxID=667725 RepID=A0A0L0GC37_9EUKA|nr:hypothetical protein SARC_01376 [Sphaeroforma arctica JP610]KNC86466.1 hypothetical protein SARC_01376 [Sphaeroforma arctica JP610]|eukprot:XP_014160368.1 hypothetical protein SARC_01376 [Sphaeroforma arctica JP610]